MKTDGTDNIARGEKIKPEKCSTLTPLLNTGTFFSREEWLAMHAAQMSPPPEKQSPDILMLGDSILHGWSWPGRPEIWHRRLPGLSAANLAVSGDYIQHLLWRIKNGNLAVFRPRIALLMIGANNIDEYTVEEIVAGVLNIAALIKHACPKR